jgi:hypothetical protein
MELQEVLRQPDGFTPPAVTVTIEKVYPYKSGTNENGPWSFQEIKTNSGSLKLKNLPEFPESRVGQTVTIRANHSQQHGLTGLKVAHEQYNGKTYDKLHVTSSAKWEWAMAVTNGNGASPAGAQHNGPLDSTVYSDHLLSCAELASLVMGKLEVDDAQAIQACFATICIDTKNRNILLPKPKTLQSVEDGPSEPDEPHSSPFGEDDIPF